MLYINKKIKVGKRQVGADKIPCLLVDERSDGKELFLPIIFCNVGQYIDKGLHRELVLDTLCVNKESMLCIREADERDRNVHLILSSKHDGDSSSISGSGYISVPKDQESKILVTSRKRERKSKKLSIKELINVKRTETSPNYEIAIIEAQEDDIFRVIQQDYLRSKLPAHYYIVTSDGIDEVGQDYLSIYANRTGFEMPFRIEQLDGKIFINCADWCEI